MFCPKCGTPCVDNAQICGNCATPLPLEPVTFAPPRKGSHLPPVIIMAVMLCIGLVCFFLFPKTRDSDTPGAAQRNYFECSMGTLQFYPEYYTGAESLTVPDTMDDMPVLRIGEYGFANSGMLEEIILPESLIEIDNSGFEGCSSLRGIYIPGGVFRVGTRAFADCTALEAVYIHGNIQTIENDAFAGCSALRHIFFDGTLSQWKALYTGELPMSVTLYCSDGTYQQGPVLP